jgi:hypothetical protein
MRILLIVIVIGFISCNENVSGNSKPLPTSITEPACNENYDSILAKLAHEFKPASVDLDRSISGRIDSFLLAADTVCLRNQKGYKLFIATILAKEFYYHVSIGHQGYDLQSMDGGGARIIVEDFKKMAGYQGRHLEMLNSGTIMDFIKKDDSLKNELSYLIKQIEKKSDEVDSLHHVK